MTKIAKIAAYMVIFLAIAGISAYLTLTLIIRSEKTVVVPELEGKDVVYTLQILTDLGLNTKINGSEFNEEIPVNRIIYQDPAPGNEIKSGRDVRIILSKGPKLIPMPNLNRLPLRQAITILEENRLRLNVKTPIYDYSYPRDSVIAQSISPGSMIKRDAEINFLISMGPRPRATMMPDLENLSMENAIEKIEKAGLVLGKLDSTVAKGRKTGVILSQNPPMGHRVVENSSVNLVINQHNKETEVENRHRNPWTQFFRYRAPSGFLKRHVRVEMSTPGFSIDLFNDFMKPGQEIWLLIPQYEEVSLTLFEDNSVIKTKTINYN